MSVYSFHDALPSGMKMGFDPWLFHQQDQLLFQEKNNWKIFCVSHAKQGLIKAVFPVHVEGPLALSPVRSPFGSWQCADDLPPETLFQFLGYVEDRLREDGIKKMVVKNPPDAYQPFMAPVVNTSLLNIGYTVVDAEVGMVLDVDASPLERRLESWEDRKLKQSRNAGLFFSTEPDDAFDEIFNFIVLCRKEKGYGFSADRENMVKQRNAFPQHYPLFSVRKEGKLVAASMSVKINPSILYNFASAHEEGQARFSPVVMLLAGMYRYAQEQGFRLLDLGTSAVKGRPNFNLLGFKHRMGGRPVMKLTFQKVFENETSR